MAVTQIPHQIGLTIAAGLGTKPVPLDPYRSRDFFEREREQLFRRAWLMMARAEELPNPGDFVVKQVDPCGVSALITRAKTGRVQAFYNSCSHRGSAVVSEACGNRSRFVCPYHNWTYGSDGRLIGITDEANFFGVDKAACGLRPIATDVWEGWVFINLSPRPEVDLDTFLGSFKDHFAGFTYQGVETPVIFSAELSANWKVVSDAFVETYHITCIHPRTIGTTFASSENPYGRFLSGKLMGPHSHVSMYGNPNYKTDPVNKVEVLAYSAAGSVIAAATVEETREFLSHPSINPTKSPGWSMDVNLIFPNTQIDCGPGGFWTHQFWPLTENTSRYEGRFYMKKSRNMRERLQQELYVGRVIEVILEDLVNVARTQRGIDTGGQKFMILQDSEIAIRHSVEQVTRWVEAESVSEALA